MEPNAEVLQLEADLRSELDLMQDPREATKIDYSRVLTQADIATNRDLVRQGYMAGDEVDSEGNYVRTVSDEPEGQIILQEDIDAYPDLLEDAEEGDFFVNGRVIKSGENDNIRNAMYGFSKANTVLGDIIRYVGSEVPDIGAMLVDVPYEQFADMSPQQRRSFFIAEKQRKLDEEYADFKPVDNAAQFAGNIVGTLADPTTLIPFGAGVKGATAIGAGLGATAAGASDLAKTGELDASNLAVGTAVGAAGGLVAGLLPKAIQATSKPKLTARGKEVVNKVRNKISLGMPLSKAVKETAEETSLPATKVNRITMENSDIIAPPNASTLATEELDSIKVNDPTYFRAAVDGGAKYLDSMASVLTNISPKLGGLLNKFEVTTALKTGTRLKNVEPFLKSLRSMPEETQQTIARMLNNDMFDDAIAEGTLYVPNFKAQAVAVRRILREVAKDFDIPARGNYFPRIVKDYKGLVNATGREYREGLNNELHEQALKRNKTVETLDAEERTEIINTYLRKNPYAGKVGTAKGGFQEGRKIDIVPEELQKFYAKPEEALSLYLRKATSTAQRNKIFGLTPSGKTADDVRVSFGSLIDKEVKAGRMKLEDADRAKDLLSARFTTGEKNTDGWVATIRDLGYATTIANPISALVNLQDLATTMAIYGFKNTIASMFKTKDIKLVDFAMDDSIASEFMDFTKSSQVLSRLFKASGFRAVDSLAKETTMNAAFRKFSNMAKTKKGLRDLEEYRDMFGNQYGLMVSQLKQGQVTPLTKMLSLAALSKQQPIFRSTNSEFWNKNPNARIVYLLKSFMLRQLQLARDLTVNEFRKGNKAKAVKNATLLAGYLSTVGLAVQSTKNVLLGRDMEVDDIPDTALWALLGTYGLNEYISQRYLGQGDITGAAGSLLIPAMPLLDAAAKGAIDAADPETEVKFEQLVRPIPIIGPLAYSLLGGGMEKAN